MTNAGALLRELREWAWQQQWQAPTVEYRRCAKDAVVRIDAMLARAPQPQPAQWEEDHEDGAGGAEQRLPDPQPQPAPEEPKQTTWPTACPPEPHPVSECGSAPRREQAQPAQEENRCRRQRPRFDEDGAEIDVVDGTECNLALPCPIHDAPRREQAQASEAAPLQPGRIGPSPLIGPGTRRPSSGDLSKRDKMHGKKVDAMDFIEEIHDLQGQRFKLTEENAALRKENEELRADARKWYLGDGSFELMDTAEDVVERRKWFAKFINTQADEINALCKARDAAREEVQALLAKVAGLKKRMADIAGIAGVAGATTVQ